MTGCDAWRARLPRPDPVRTSLTGITSASSVPRLHNSRRAARPTPRPLDLLDLSLDTKSGQINLLPQLCAIDVGSEAAAATCHRDFPRACALVWIGGSSDVRAARHAAVALWQPSSRQHSDGNAQDFRRAFQTSN